MALSRVLNERTGCPYSKPPNLHISVLKMQEEQRVVDWFFTEISAKAATVKKNRVAVISDGHSLATITLFEEYKGAVKEGTSYIIVGYGLRGQSPPYLIKIDRQTKRESAEEKGLVTIQGTVVELLSLKKVQAGRNLVPLRNIGVQKDEFMISIWLWRELSVISLSIGDMITVSHLKVDSTMYRHQLKSTRYSKLEHVCCHKPDYQSPLWIVQFLPGSLLNDPQRRLVLWFMAANMLGNHRVTPHKNRLDEKLS